jgi:hypothetical protein
MPSVCGDAVEGCTIGRPYALMGSKSIAIPLGLSGPLTLPKFYYLWVKRIQAFCRQPHKIIGKF